MADLLSQIGDLLYWEAKKDPQLFNDRRDRPHFSNLAKRMGIKQPIVWKLYYGKRDLSKNRDPNRPIPDFTPGTATLEGIGRLLNIDPDRRDLIYRAILNAPPRPPERHQQRKPRKSKKKS